MSHLAAWQRGWARTARDDGEAMTSLLPARPSVPTRTPAGAPRRRPVALLGALAGLVAAASTLAVCLAVGVIGWFLSDAGVHGAPREGMRAGALGWLAAHGSGLQVGGVPVDVVPLGLTAIVAWVVWRLAMRLGEAVSAHGPDAHSISDGERDWTVPAAVGSLFTGYSLVAVVTSSLAGGDVAPSVTPVLGWTLLLTVLVAAPAVAIGSGRAAIWATYLPPVLRYGVRTALAVLGTFLVVSGAVLLVALAVDLAAALNMASRLHTGAGEATLLTLVNAGFVPNATLFSGSYLLGPGFEVGANTLVSPGAVVLGPLPIFPLLAALPTAGAVPAWAAAVVAVPPLVAALATARVQRRFPTLRWDEGAMRGCGGGIIAGLLFALLASLSGGAAGPGRMRFIGPFGFDVLVHAVTAFGLGGLLGGLLMTWWQRRTSIPVEEGTPQTKPQTRPQTKP